MGISSFHWVFSLLIILAALFLSRVVLKTIIMIMMKGAGKTETKWDDEIVEAIRPPLNFMIVAYGFFLAIKTLPIPTEPYDINILLNMAGRLLILIVGAWTLWRLVAVFNSVLHEKANDPEHWLDVDFVPVFSGVLKALVIFTAMIVLAQNMGYSVSGLVASLGIGGAALALASKDTLSNLFGSFMILMDKPFMVGDWIKGPSFEGIVENIGFRSTRIRTFGKTIENIPNNLIANEIVENLDRRKDHGLNVRRVTMTIGVSYSTSADKMTEAVDEIRKILHEDESVDQRMNIVVQFTEFGASSLDILVYFFVNKTNWEYYLGVKQRVNLKIMRKLEQLGITIAFPSQSVYIESMPEPKTDS